MNDLARVAKDLLQELGNWDKPIVGQYYTVKEHSDEWIMLVILFEEDTKYDTDNKYTHVCQADFLWVNRKDLHINGPICFYRTDNGKAEIRTYRESTEEEVAWLNKCIKANKYVEK